MIVQALLEVTHPVLGPGAKFGGPAFGEAVGVELLVVGPVRTGEAVAEVVEPEFVPAVPLAESASTSMTRTRQPRVARPCSRRATICAIGAGFSVATSRS
ncbi:hypothetical protein ADK92_26990 [Streptomyces sp. XY533]|nr:hypothetical protein ADK92_26990 [Streptomyces sp. XY533]